MSPESSSDMESSSVTPPLELPIPQWLRAFRSPGLALRFTGAFFASALAFAIVVWLLEPREWLRARFDATVAGLALFAVLAALWAGLLVWLVDRRLAAPLRKLADAARRAAEGLEDAGIPPLDRRDEIGALGDAVRGLHRALRTRLEREGEERTRLRAVLDAMGEGVMMVDAGSRIRTVNKAFLRIQGLEEEAAFYKGRPYAAVEPDPVLHAVIQETLSGKARSGVELPPDEQDHTMMVNSVPLMDGERVTGAVVVFHDITRLKALETQRRDFVANASHELKTPLTAIQGYTETLLLGAMDDPKLARKFLEVVHRNALRLGNLVRDLLDLTRIESSAWRLEPGPVRVDELIDRQLTTLDKRVKAKRIGVVRDIPEGDWTLMSDEGLLEQVLVNLLDNAVKYNRDDGQLLVRLAWVDRREIGWESPHAPPPEIPSDSQPGTAHSDGEPHATDHPPPMALRIEIADTGPGIPADEQLRIFERFYRVDKARSREMGGTGLGLAIAKHVTARLGGRIGISSAPGAGTRFVVDLPITLPPAPVTPDEEAAVVRVIPHLPQQGRESR